MKINHIGVIVKNIERDIRLYTKLGYILKGKIWVDNIQNNRIAILRSDFSPDIELIEPIDRNSSVYNFDSGYHHVCYESEREENIIEFFQSIKIGKIFTPPIVSPAFNNRCVVFACLRNGTFVEFLL